MCDCPGPLSSLGRPDAQSPAFHGNLGDTTSFIHPITLVLISVRPALWKAWTNVESPRALDAAATIAAARTVKGMATALRPSPPSCPASFADCDDHAIVRTDLHLQVGGTGTNAALAAVIRPGAPLCSGLPSNHAETLSTGVMVCTIRQPTA